MAYEKNHGTIMDLPEAPGNFIEHSSKKVIFGPDNWWEDYVMRCFTFDPGKGLGSANHSHPGPHFIVILKGEGLFHIEDEEFTAKAGDYVYIPPMPYHDFKNNSDTEEFRFLCIVPKAGDVNPLLGKGC